MKLLKGSFNACQPLITVSQEFPGGLMVKNPTSAGDTGLIRGSGKEMATHSSILAWRISRTEEPYRLQPMGSQRVEHS